MNRKSKKRLSILKKASSEESSPTFTKLNRRISFSGKKSIKEFTSDDNKMTIWGNSYEESAEMAQSASHHTLAADSMISQSITQTNMCSIVKSESIDKENDLFNLRNRKVLKRKSNVLKSIPVEQATYEKNITPNIETVEMDISMNGDDKSLNRISDDKFQSPNLTPVPPQKVSKLNQTANDVCATPPYLKHRISNDSSDFSITRILDKGSINLTYGFNMSELDILKSKRRPSENVTSFATKIDRINFSNEDETDKKDNSVVLKIENPQIEQMRITGTIATATDQNLDISIEICDRKKKLDSTIRDAIELKEEGMVETPIKHVSPKANPVLEMFKIRNELKKQMDKQFKEKLEKECIVPFTPAKFDPPFMMNFVSKNLDKPETTKRQTIFFADDNVDLDMSRSEGDLIDCGSKSKKDTLPIEKLIRNSMGQCVEPTLTQNESLDITLSTTPIPRATINFLEHADHESSCDDVFEDALPTHTNRKTIHFPNQELDVSTSERGQNEAAKEVRGKRDTIHFPNNQLEISTIESCPIVRGENSNHNITVTDKLGGKYGRRKNRGTIHFTNQDLDLSIIDSSTNETSMIERDLTLQSKVYEEHQTDVKGQKETYGKLTTRGTIYFPKEVELSTVESKINAQNINTVRSVVESVNEMTKIEPYLSAAKRDTIQFPNNQLQESKLDEPSPNTKVGHSNLNLIVAAKISQECARQTKRETIYFANQELEMSTIESCRKQKDDNIIEKTNQELIKPLNKTTENSGLKTQRTIYFPNKELEMSMVEEEHPAKLKAQKAKYDKSTNRETIYFDLSTLETVAPKIREEIESHPNHSFTLPQSNLNLKVATDINEKSERQTKRRTLHFPNQELEMSMIESCVETQRNTMYFQNKELEKSMGIEDHQADTKGAMPKYKKLTNRGTIYFPNQEVDISIVDTVSNVKDHDLNQYSICGATNAGVMQERSKTRDTLHYANQELDTTMNVESTNKNLNIIVAAKIREAQSNRGTLHFPNEHLDMSTIDSCPNETKRDTHHLQNQSQSNLKMATETSEKCEKQIKRDTFHFPNEELEMSTIKSCPNQRVENTNLRPKLSEKCKEPNKRGTIHYPNQELETSIMVEPVNSNELDKIGEKQIQRNTIYFQNKELGISLANEVSDIKHQDLNQNSKGVMQKTNKIRDTLHYANQELDTTIDVESTNKNLNKIVTPKIREAQSNRGTIHYPNEQLDMSTVESPDPNRFSNIPQSNLNLPVGTVINEQSELKIKRGTLHFPNQELQTSTIESMCSNQKKENTILEAKLSEKFKEPNTRGTIHYPNQELETSMVGDSVKSHALAKTNEYRKRQTPRKTIYFTNKELDISVTPGEPEADLKGQMEKCKQSINRGTIHFPNEEANIVTVEKCFGPVNNMSMVELCPKGTKRGTIHFPNEQLEMSKLEQLPNKAEKSEIQKKRGTLHFPNQEFELSMQVESKLKLSENFKGSTKRGTIHYPNQQFRDSQNLDVTQIDDLSNMDMSILTDNQSIGKLGNTDSEQIKSDAANRITTYFANEDLDASMENVKPIPINSSENDHDVSIQEPAKHVDHAPEFDMTVPENNLDASVPRKVYPRTPLHRKMFKLNAEVTRKFGSIRPEPLIPGSTYYEDKTLDLSEFEIKNRHQLYNDEEEGEEENLNESEIEPKIESVKQPSSRSTIYFPNQALDDSENRDVDQMDISITESIGNNSLTRAKHVGRGSIIDYKSNDMETNQICEKQPNSTGNRKTILYNNQDLENTLPVEDANANKLTARFQSRIKELEEKIWAKPISANVSRAASNMSNSNLNNNDKSNTDIEDLNMTNDFDENHINQQSTTTNMARIFQLLVEKRKNALELVNINLVNAEMDLSNYEKPDEHLLKDMSGLKLFGHDTTDFENNTQALCNLDPQRIYRMSKFDTTNVTTNSKQENVLTATKRSLLPLPILKSGPTIDRPSILVEQFLDNTMLRDIVPRDRDMTTEDVIDINLPQKIKTRQEICNDYINLTLSRFSGSFANSSNIDQTSLQLVNSHGDLEEHEEEEVVSAAAAAATKEPTNPARGIKYVNLEEVDENIDKMLDLTKCQKLLNQPPSFREIANSYKLKNMINSKRVSELHEPVQGPAKPSLRFLMKNYREQLMKEFSEKNCKHVGIPSFLPLTPKITMLLQNKLAERTNYWTCHDLFYYQGIIEFTHHRVPCVKIKMLFEYPDETEFGELEFTRVIPMMSKTKILASTFELMQHLQFFKKVPPDMINLCNRSNNILQFLEYLDSKIIKKNYEDIQKLKEIVVSTNSKIWHENETGQCGITKTLIFNRNIYDIVIKISDLHITDISDVTVKPKVGPTNKIRDLSQGLDFIQKLLEKPRDYFNFNK